MKTRCCVALFLTGALAAVLCWGCGKARVTAENCDKIKPGMTLAQVREILGSDGEPAGTAITMPGGARVDAAPVGGAVYTWEERGKSISVLIINDRLITSTRSGM